MPHPDMELLKEHEAGLRMAMQPIYPSTENLSKKGISNKVISKIIQQLFSESKQGFTETLPQSILQELKLVSKSEALLNIDFPQAPKKL